MCAPAAGQLGAASVYFEGQRAKPLSGLNRRAPKGRLPDPPPPVVPHLESLAAQAAYTEARVYVYYYSTYHKAVRGGSIALVSLGPKIFQALLFVILFSPDLKTIKYLRKISTSCDASEQPRPEIASNGSAWRRK